MVLHAVPLECHISDFQALRALHIAQSFPSFCRNSPYILAKNHEIPRAVPQDLHGLNAQACCGNKEASAAADCSGSMKASNLHGTE